MAGLVSHDYPVVMIGSCFTDNIGARLRGELYDCIVNPCGTLYNPASIASSMLDLLYDRDFTAGELFQHEGVWRSYSHHSRFSGTDREAVLRMMNDAAAEAREALQRASVLIVTFGTAWIFRLKEDKPRCGELSQAACIAFQPGDAQHYSDYRSLEKDIA